ncbi:MAG: PPC domain-containing protein [Verrucomicrobia bacterium]|nr:PPC domain-containing protein [Verrucomicrobiota bacterium]
MTKHQWLCWLLLAALPATAQPVPKLNSLSAEWLKRGSTTEVVLEGEGLNAVTDLIFSGELGLSGSRAPLPQAVATLEGSKGGIAPAGDDDKKFTARIGVAPEATLGAREVRARTASGLSNPLTVNVSDIPEILELEPNNSTNEAQVVELPVGLSGVIHEAAQIDWFRFKASKGRRLIFDVQANRRGAPLDPSLGLFDVNGKELARGEDDHGLDSFIDFTVPEDGEYFLQMRDFRYQGGGDYKYHLVAGELPYLDGLFPFGAQRGQAVEVTLRGRNLDGADKLKLKIASDAPLGSQDIRAHAAKGYSNTRPFDISEAPQFMETEPNNETNKANQVILPVAINGRIGDAKDVDHFKFKVEVGQTFIFEVLANRFGSPLDALLTLAKADGSVLQRNDDAAGADARIEQNFGEAGEYFLSLRDLTDRGGEEFGYRLTVRRPQPNFSVSFLTDTPRLRRSAYTSFRVEVSRQGGFGGGVEVTCEGLPKEITALPLVIPPELSGGELFLTANADAQLGFFPFQVKATGVIASRKVTRTAEPKSGDRTVKEAFLTVLDTAPFSVEPLTLTAAVEQNQSTGVEVLLTRRAGFLDDVQLSLEGFSTGRDPITRSVETQPVTLKGTDTRATINLKARLDSELGTRPIWIKAEGQGMTILSRPLTLTIGEFPFSLSTSLPRLGVTVPPPGVKSEAAEAEMTVKTARRGWFTDDITLALEGLPEGVAATSTNLPRGVTEALFRFTASDKAKAGTNTVTFIGTTSVNGRNFQNRAAFTLTVNAAAEPEVATSVKTEADPKSEAK